MNQEEEIIHRFVETDGARDRTVCGLTVLPCYTTLDQKLVTCLECQHESGVFLEGKGRGMKSEEEIRNRIEFLQEDLKTAPKAVSQGLGPVYGVICEELARNTLQSGIATLQWVLGEDE